MHHRSVVALLAAALLVTAACSGSEDDASPTVPATEAPAATQAPPEPEPTAAPTTPETTPATTPETTEAPTPETTEAPVEPTLEFAEPGPYGIGVTTVQLPTGPLVEIWYPAPEGTEGEISYDIRDFTPQAIRDLLTADIPASFTHPGARDVEAAEGSFPVVLFSHGFTGIRLQSSFLTSHLASHGMIVAAPDHPSRDLPNVLGGTASGDRQASVDDLLGTLDLVLALGDDPTSLLAGRIDGDRVATLGHSAGGGTILGASLDPRIDGYVSMAAGGPAEGAEYPQVPSFFLAGATDGVVTPTERTRPAFEGAPSPTWYWEIAETGHNGFDDFCTFGNGTGIIGIAEASGLGGLLDAQPQLRTLGEDGCVPPAAPVDLAFPLVRHGVAAWLTWLFDGAEGAPTLIGADVAATGDLAVEVAER